MSFLESNDFVKNHKNKVNPTYRNNFHLMAPIGWMNDPNGFVYYRGQYHLFFQYYPYDSVWGPMHWGHSVSDDGVHWRELPTALEPDQWYDRDGCFSGTAYVENDILYLMYTGHVVENGIVKQTQCLAQSLDGIYFMKHEANPIIHEEHLNNLGTIHDFRDPKLIKHKSSYYALVASKTKDNLGQILIFTSDDMSTWSNAHLFLEGTESQGVMWECPDLFTVDGYDVLILSPIQMPSQGCSYTNISSTVAFIGHVNWETLTFNVVEEHEIDNGFDFYAPQTMEDDRGIRYLVAWMQMWDRTMVTHDLGHNWAGSMTLLRQIGIKDKKLVQQPIASFVNKLKHVDETVDTAGWFEIAPNPDYIQFQTDQPTFNLRLVADGDEFVELNYDKEILTLSRGNSGHSIHGAEGKDYISRCLKNIASIDDLRIVIDVSSIEIFINHQYTMTTTFFKKKDERKALIKGLAVGTRVVHGKIL